jgi:hypothetical protein
MNGDDIKEVSNLTRQAQVVQAIPGDTRGYLERQTDGAYTRRELPLEPQNATAFSLESLIDMVSTAETCKHILVSPTAVTAIFEQGTYRWSVTAKLPVHPVMAWIMNHREPREYAQRDLVRVLRSSLAGFVDKTLTMTLRELSFKSDGSGFSVVQSGMEHIGKTLKKAVQGANGGGLPDEFSVSAPVFDTPEMRTITYPVTILLETDSSDDTPSFELTAVYNDVAAAFEHATLEVVMILGKLLAESAVLSVPVFRANV